MEDKNFTDAMSRMIADNGKEVLLGDKVKAYISDYKGQFDKEATVFIRLLDAGCAKFINEADDVLERKLLLVKRMDEKEFISPRISMQMLDLLGFLLRGDTSRIAKSAEELNVEEEAKIKAEAEAKIKAEAEAKDDAEAKRKVETDAKENAEAKAAAETRRKAEAEYNSFKPRYDEACALSNDKKRFQMLETLANEGYAPAQEKLSDCYSYGRGVWGNDKKANEWWSKARESYRKFAEQGVAEAQYKLGDYYHSLGPSNNKKYAEWYRKAAEQGHADAQHWLGILFQVGDGVPQDYAKAAEWYSKAAAHGHKSAKESLAKLKSEGKI